MSTVGFPSRHVRPCKPLQRRGQHHLTLGGVPEAHGTADQATDRTVGQTKERSDIGADHPTGVWCRYSVFRLTPSVLAMASTVCSFTACRR
jgi:hypothetical protein